MALYSTIGAGFEIIFERKHKSAEDKYSYVLVIMLCLLVEKGILQSLLSLHCHWPAKGVLSSAMIMVAQVSAPCAIAPFGQSCIYRG